MEHPESFLFVKDNYEPYDNCIRNSHDLKIFFNHMERIARKRNMNLNFPDKFSNPKQMNIEYLYLYIHFCFMKDEDFFYPREKEKHMDLMKKIHDEINEVWLHPDNIVYYHILNSKESLIPFTENKLFN